jgi:tRNA U34 5-methylaminomethyl-2-thiouridine-forming methyltransferase MnmC
MRTAPIVAARVAYDSDGTPLAPDDGDLYHPRHGALEQARHVFLGGNGLPARWRGRARFVILETGFGLGNNFLATWLAWRDDAQRCANLHFISIEARPPCAEDLAALPRDPAFAPLATQLAAAWPPLTWNLHRLSFESGRVQLLLAFGDVSAWLPQIDAAVDAFFLDGFAPAKNPHMWEARLFKAMARIAASDRRDVVGGTTRARRLARRRLRLHPRRGQRRQAPHHHRPLRAWLRAALDAAAHASPVPRSRRACPHHRRRARRMRYGMGTGRARDCVFTLRTERDDRQRRIGQRRRARARRRPSR